MYALSAPQSSIDKYEDYHRNDVAPFVGEMPLAHVDTAGGAGKIRQAWKYTSSKGHYLTGGTPITVV